MKKLILLSLSLFLAPYIYGQKEAVQQTGNFPLTTDQLIAIDRPLFNANPLDFTKAELKLPDNFELVPGKVIHSKTAVHYHYDLTYYGVRVYGFDVHTVVANDQKVRNIISPTLPSIIGEEENFPEPMSELYRTQQGATYTKKDEPVWVIHDHRLVPARLAEFVTDNELHQEVIYTEDKVLYTIDKIKKHHAAGPNDTIAYGYIFEPDPLTTAQVNYGSPYVDNNDLDVSVLNAERKLKSFTVSFEGGEFVLKNDFVKIADFSPPNLAPVTSTNDQFQYTRSQNGFEDVNVLYHISNHKQHLDNLGFSNLPGYTIQIDPHALSGSDNSYFYTSASPYRILMGEGGVDDAEDADVIIHEYTHAYVLAAAGSNNGSVERNTIEESLGDYFAASYSRSINQFNKGQVFSWDGHNQYWSGRVVESLKDYQQLQFASSIYAHTDIFASALMEIYSMIGRNATDEIVMEAIFSMSQNTTMPQMAMYVVQADAALNGSANYQVIVDAFIRRNILDASLSSDDPLAYAKSQINLSGTHEFSMGGNLSIESVEQPISQYTIYALSGKPLESHTLEYPLQKISVGSENLSTGIYLLKVQLKNGLTATYKVSRL